MNNNDMFIELILNYSNKQHYISQNIIELWPLNVSVWTTQSL